MKIENGEFVFVVALVVALLIVVAEQARGCQESSDARMTVTTCLEHHTPAECKALVKQEGK